MQKYIYIYKYFKRTEIGEKNKENNYKCDKVLVYICVASM